MNRKQFIEGLKQALEMKMSKNEIDEQVDYYTTYIKSEVKSGRSESDVIDELGDPWAIAKNLNVSSGNTWEESPKVPEPEESSDTNFGGKVYTTNNKWVGFAVIFVIFAVLFAILSLFFGIMKLLSPILLPALFVYMILRLLRR